MSPALIKAVVDQAAFLALSNDDVINPDTAVSQLEQLADTLKDLSADDRNAFLRYVETLTREERRSGGDADRIAFLEALPENLGIG